MATLLTLDAELQQMKVQMHQLRDYTNAAQAKLTESASTQTTKLQTVEGDLRPLCDKADQAIHAINVDLEVMKEEKGRHGKDKTKTY